MSKYAPHKRSTNQPRATTSTVCQKCLQRGHYIYECKSERPYVARPSRTQQLENPRSLAKLKSEGKPSVEVPEEFKSSSGVANKILEAKEKERADETRKQNVASSSRKRARSSHSSSSSDSERTSDSESDSSSGSESDSSSASSSSSSAASRSRSRGRKRRRSRTPSSGSDSSRRRR